MPSNSALPTTCIGSKPIGVVKDFKYLGSHMASIDRDINSRIALAWVTFNKIKTILTSRTDKPSVKLKMRLYNAACISVLLYGCETWVLTKQQSNRLDVHTRVCIRLMMAIRQSEDHITNSVL